jgi:hypothetical protein
MFLNFIKRKLIFEAKRKFASVEHIGELRSDTNTLIVSYRHELSDTQIYPFYFYKNRLIKNSKIKFQEIDLARILCLETNLKNKNVVRIYFQHGFMMENKQVVLCLEKLVETFPNAKIAFMDWFAPLHIQYSNDIDSFIDRYIKKQTFKNFDNYNNKTLGDTNLCDFYAKRFNLPEPTMQFKSPIGFESKIELWPNFYLSPQMVDLFLGPIPKFDGRSIDLHARIAVKGTPWYESMRNEAKNAIIKIKKDIVIVSEGRVKRHKFFSELKNSKFVFSPFGYGEICWRDYEAFATGALLIKPSMEHLVTDIDIFRDQETYLATKWDLKDLEENISKYIEDNINRREMTTRAFVEIKNKIVGNDFVDQISLAN